jgi:hypothetical protein
MVFAIYGKIMATRFFFPFTFYILHLLAAGKFKSSTFGFHTH